ncbi:1-acylglycerol-3-phosphate O-acyltransferase [Bacillus lacus]|uniref:1-acyl-sn-glycerol-3-phosphate acyltransferase n=2 Tax=Metabacillus lacus TaxID=1983721 RepID=A0A7X2IWT4_9BACI|nr:1-acylglycerol-3-phosphate O-acyltransferase [Metabacillus lacus]
MIYGALFVLFSLPKLRKIKKIGPDVPVALRDNAAHQQPELLGRRLLKITGSDITVSGRENIPDGPVLFVSNHQGNFDIFVCLGYLEKPIGFLSKVEVKKIPVVPKWMEAINCIFIDRRNRRQALLSLKEGTEKLRNGHSLLIFPEGTRSKGRQLGEFKTGALRMARDAAVPIVPVAINGTYAIMEHNTGPVLKPASVTLSISKPLLPEDYMNMDLTEIAQRLHHTIQQSLEK